MLAELAIIREVPSFFVVFRHQDYCRQCIQQAATTYLRMLSEVPSRIKSSTFTVAEHIPAWHAALQPMSHLTKTLLSPRTHSPTAHVTPHKDPIGSFNTTNNKTRTILRMIVGTSMMVNIVILTESRRQASRHAWEGTS